MNLEKLGNAFKSAESLDFSKISEAYSRFEKFNLGGFPDIGINTAKLEIPPMPELELIDPENTIMGDIKRKIEEQNALATKQFEILVEQNQLLADNYNKLKNLYEQQIEINAESREDLKRSRSYNRWMMAIAIIAMFAAIASPIVTIIVSK